MRFKLILRWWGREAGEADIAKAVVGGSRAPALAEVDAICIKRRTLAALGRWYHAWVQAEKHTRA